MSALVSAHPANDATALFALDEGAIAAEVLSNRMRTYNDRSLSGAMMAPVGIALLAWMQVSAAGWQPTLAWVSVMAVVELAIAVVALRYRACRARGQEGRGWAHAQIAGSLVVGLAWGSSVWFFHEQGQFIAHLANLTVLVGVAGVTNIIMSPFWRTTLLFCAGVLVMPVAHLMLVDTDIAAFSGVGLAVFCVVQLKYARDVERELSRELDSAARNRHQVALLSTARVELHEANRRLESGNADLVAALRKVNDMLTHDELTGAYNRRFIFEQLEAMVAMKQRHGSPVCLIMFDLDHFKSINDRHGHPVGDRALKAVVHAVKGQLRDGDLLARVGGEEFLVALPMTRLEQASLLTARLQTTLSSTSVVEAGHTIFLPASFGVCECRLDDTVPSWFKRVDLALYQAKAAGRNRLVAA